MGVHPVCSFGPRALIVGSPLGHLKPVKLKFLASFYFLGFWSYAGQYTLKIENIQKMSDLKKKKKHQKIREVEESRKKEGYFRSKLEKGIFSRSETYCAKTYYFYKFRILTVLIVFVKQFFFIAFCYFKLYIIVLMKHF